MTSLPSWTWDVNPVLYQSETLAIRYYSVVVVAELLLGYWLLLLHLRRAGVDDEEAGDLFTYVYPAVFIGSRLGHVLFFDFQTLWSNPWWVFKVWTGGLAGHGALVGVGVATYLFTKRRAMAWLEGMDRLSFSIAFVAIVHRLGNLMNSELVGKPTDGTWGVRFARFDHDLLVPPLRHPTQLYEMALGVVVLLALLLCDRTWGGEKRPRGALTGVLLTLLFSGRILIEVFKESEMGEPALPWLNMGQLLSLPCVALGLAILWRSLRQPRPAGWIVGASSESRDASRLAV